MKTNPWTGAFVLASAIVTTSCNVYDPFDSATSDPQLISAARACLDRGDYACAKDNYEKLSSAENDTKISEEAFLALDQAGLGMKAFASAFGKGAGVSAFNKLIASVAPNASKTTRLSLYNDAFLKWQLIQNTELRALVKFVTSAALAAEVLGEGAGGDTFSASELASDPTACKAASETACTSTPGCMGPASGTGSNLVLTAISFDLMTTSPSNDNPDLGYFNSAASYTNEGLQELGVSGSFQTANTELTTIIGKISGAEGCYRRILLTQGIGE